LNLNPVLLATTFPRLSTLLADKFVASPLEVHNKQVQEVDFALVTSGHWSLPF
jgi:hypothetical protein